MNFTRLVKVPVLMSSGLIGTALPPMTALSIHNNTLPGLKQIGLVPLLGHNAGPRFQDMRNRFLVEQAGISDPTGKATGPIIMCAPIDKK